MKNVTVSMPEEALEWVRIKAARENASVSRYLGELVEQARLRDGGYERVMRAALKFKPLNFSQERALPEPRRGERPCRSSLTPTS